MKSYNSFTICFKEIKDFFRDKKSITLLIFAPLFMMFVFPSALILIGIPSPSSPISVMVMNGDEDFFSYINSNTFLSIKRVDVNATIDNISIQNIVNEGSIFILFTHKSSESKVDIYYNSQNPKSTVGITLITDALNRYQNYLVRQNLKTNFNISDENIESILNPLTTTTTDLSPTRTEGIKDIGKTFLMIVPFLFVLWGGSSSFGIVIDIFTGEKERKTFEPLLSLPIKRSKIVFGKFLSVFFINCFITLPIIFLSIFGLILLFKHVLTAYDVQNFIVTFDPFIIGAMIVVFILYTALISSIIIIPAIAAKNFRQASIFTFPIYTFIMLLGISSLFVVDIPFYYCFLPIVNIITTILGLISGITGIFELVITICTTIIYITIILLVVTYLFNQDTVIFRE